MLQFKGENHIIGINDMEGGKGGREGEGTSSYHVQLSSHSFLRHQEVKLHSSSPGEA